MSIFKVTLTTKGLHVHIDHISGCNYVMHLSMLSQREGGPRAYVGHLTFRENFWSKSPLWGPEILVKSDQISPPSQWIENILINRIPTLDFLT